MCGKQLLKNLNSAGEQGRWENVLTKNRKKRTVIGCEKSYIFFTSNWHTLHSVFFSYDCVVGLFQFKDAGQRCNC